MQLTVISTCMGGGSYKRKAKKGSHKLLLQAEVCLQAEVEVVRLEVFAAL